ncbi:MAG: ABC transporter permease subunit [Pseudomonadales bacterium]
MAGSAGLSQLPGRRRLVNALTRYVVALGGAGVIGAIALIFFYLVWVVAPVFVGADIETGRAYELPPAQALAVSSNESDEVGLRIDSEGQATFFSIENGRILQQHAFDHRLRQVIDVAGHTGLYALLDEDDTLAFVQASYPVSFDGDERSVDPHIEYVFEDDWLELGEVDALDAFYGNFEVRVATLQGRNLTVRQYRDAESGFALEMPRRGHVRLTRSYDQVLFGPRGQWLYLIANDGTVEVVDLTRPNAPQQSYLSRLVPEDGRMTAVEPLLGRYSLLVADAAGQITQWFMVRGEFGYQLEAARSFQLESPAVRIIPEPRRKGFGAIDESGRLQLFYTTSQRHLASHPLVSTRLATASIAPRSDLLLVADPDGNVQTYDLHNEHPDISWSTLWSKVWYEGYEEPVYSWQSSSADNDFEAKFSLTPLLFGTLKGAFYAMLFAVPIAIMGAIYTAYFMAPSMRRLVKPGIEIMAALPTVILGFLAGLWLAPLIEANLSAVLSIIFVLPLGILVTAWLWGRLPDRLTARFDGWYGLIVVPVIVATVWIAFAVGPWLETLLFDGNSKAWLLEHWGLNYDQRNALVVGIAMGLAVIPTIFSIAEDAIYGVPTHLINGSLALGATPWQTLVRVVLLTASPGIFSAVMIGLGRAVGETMIVLMATGNTPIMDLNIFEGMRTFAANIAVELPESEVDSSHYRILFLAALVLFMITFLFNTVAELVRQRLRTRYGNL